MAFPNSPQRDPPPLRPVPVEQQSPLPIELPIRPVPVPPAKMRELPRQARDGKAHIALIITHAHQIPGERATGGTERSGRFLKTKDQPYGPRRLTVGPEWQPLDTGWVKEPGLILITNEEGLPKHVQVNPTPAEAAAAEARVVEVALRTEQPVPFARVPFRGECLMFTPIPGREYLLRCVAREAKVVVLCYPS